MLNEAVSGDPSSQKWARFVTGCAKGLDAQLAVLKRLLLDEGIEETQRVSAAPS